MKKIAVFLMALMLSLVLSMGTASAWFWGTNRRTVDCTKGQNPQNVLDRAIGARDLELYLIGECPGFEISRDDVTVAGGRVLEVDDDEENGENNSIDSNGGNGEEDPCTSRATITSSIKLKGARRVELYCLNVTVAEGGTVDDEDDEENRVGIEAYEGASAFVHHCLIQGNPSNGIQIGEGSNMLVESCEILDNVGTGANVAYSTAVFSETEIVGNERGITAAQGARIEVVDTSVSGNDFEGVWLSLGSNAFLMNVMISGNGTYGIWIESHSFAQVYYSTIENNGDDAFPEINLRWDAGLVLTGGSVNGDLGSAIDCFDSESSLAIEGADVNPDPSPPCSGF